VSSLDVPTIAGVALAGAGLIAAIAYLRFCGAVEMPQKPAKPRFDEAPAVVAKHRDESSDGYRQALEADARRAGIAKPTLDEMERAFVWTVDRKRHVLRPGDPPLEIAGLRLTASAGSFDGSEKLLQLTVENPGTRAVAYVVDTKLSTGNAACQNRTMIPFNGNVIEAGAKQTRSECAWKSSMEIYIDHVESAPIAPMNAYYLSQVPPQALGVSDRVGSGHRPQLPGGVNPCNVSMPQTVRRALEDGQTEWRDLADFYARHPCETYQFPDGYKAFTADGERHLPVAGD
jgi:hypothetical protein